MNIPQHYDRVPAYYRKHFPECKVRIGCMYQPPIKITPAIEIYKRGPSVWRKLGWALLLPAGFFSLYFLLGI